MATIGGINKFAIVCDLDVGTGVFATVKTDRQSRARMKGLELASSLIEMISGNAVALFVITIHDRELGMKGEVSRLKAGSRAGCEGIVGRELAVDGIKAELINGIWTGMGHKGKFIGGIGQDRVRAALGLDAAEGVLPHGTLSINSMTAHHATAVAGPQERVTGAIGGYVGCICPDVCDAQRYERFLGVIDAVGAHTIGGTHRNVQTVAIGTHKLRARRSRQVDLGALHQRTCLGIELVEMEGFVFTGGDDNEKGSKYRIHNWEQRKSRGRSE